MADKDKKKEKKQKGRPGYQVVDLEPTDAPNIATEATETSEPKSGASINYLIKTFINKSQSIHPEKDRRFDKLRRYLRTHVIGEAMDAKNRKQLAQDMIRKSGRMANSRKIASNKFASDDNIKMRAQKLARQIFRTRMTGKKGRDYKKLSVADKIAVDKIIDKQAPAIERLVKRLIPSVRRAEAMRISQKDKQLKTSKEKDYKHKHKFSG